MGNVQETVSDNKFDKDLNGDGLRDEYRAASVSVYDYYPFGMLMPGRSMLDTAGLCVTTTRYMEIPHNHWQGSGDLSVPGIVQPFGPASVNQSGSYAQGVTANRISGGIQYTITVSFDWLP